MDMRVDRDDQFRRRDRPKTEIHSVGRTNHPPRVEHEALARATCARIAYQMTRASIGGVAAQVVGQPRQAFAKVSPGLAVMEHERVAEGAMLLQEGASTRHQLREVPRAVDAMNEAVKALLQHLVAALGNQRRRRRTQHLQGPLDALSCSNRVSEGETRGHQSHDLAIGLIGVAMHVVDRIARARRYRVAIGQEGVQMVMDRGHVCGVLAILPSQPQ